MFITKLNKRDWFRLYSYLWKTNCTSRLLRYFINTAFWFITFLAIFAFYSKPITSQNFFEVIGKLVIDLSIIPFWYCFFFGGQVIRISPQILVIFETKPTPELRTLLKEDFKAQGIKSVPRYAYGIFTPPAGKKWDLLLFADYCVLYIHTFAKIRGKRRNYQIILPLKRSDIDDEATFFKRLEPVCQRKIDLSDIKLQRQNFF
ncbi:hypothetical protein AALT52_05620 [Ligilactobacillus faecis]|uniref:Uncharacterized protein n=1 Tax=Ligilactobacillus faecis TaxID=762833 RepID=A0ABV4DPG3_9LACO